MSNAQVICFNDFVLKKEKPTEESQNEYKMMAWLAEKLPVPQVVCYEKDSDMSYLLMSRIAGEKINLSKNLLFHMGIIAKYFY
ncbi:hypothetical protein Ana3638_15425 [Anaerocolumna sedimenticola]|uniref:Aminoglycoside phosphotransferase domain-containing protein n=1 Tax=Anaerocolumna sedimenticola TaxID=2696063 RepID=A0A6P1TNF9_9FIRM|nr:phosphotransferase [Anaerocolumna sedimenticola]QHQ62003.1 hypothetical protein Ana3638_15425 [Anaerocolumna sedimenticola]